MCWVRYVVTCDPVGAKIGNGGATMHVLEQLQLEMDLEELKKGIHCWAIMGPPKRSERKQPLYGGQNGSCSEVALHP